MNKNMCDACPNRAMANLNRSLGNEEEAKRIEQAGCNWWWGMEYEHVVNGKPSGLKETRYECGIVHVGAMIKDQGARVEEACQSIQSNRNEVANIRDGLVHTLEVGFGQLASVIQLQAEQLPHGQGYPRAYGAMEAPPSDPLGALREELRGLEDGPGGGA